MRKSKHNTKATSLDDAILLAKQFAKGNRKPSKVMSDLMGVELKTYYRWLLEHTMPLNRIAQFEALTQTQFISEYLCTLHGDKVVIDIPRGKKGSVIDIAQVQKIAAEAIAMLVRWYADESDANETVVALSQALSVLAYERENVKKADSPELPFGVDDE